MLYKITSGIPDFHANGKYKDVANCVGGKFFANCNVSAKFLPSPVLKSCSQLSQKTRIGFSFRVTR
jgi:hypothetical protein